MQAVFRNLCAAVDACDVPAAALGKQLVRHQSWLASAAHAFSVADRGAADDIMLDVFGTVPLQALRLLDRVLTSSQPRGLTLGTTILTPLSKAEASAVQALLRVYIAFLGSLLQHPDEGSMPPCLLPLLAAAQPCRVMANALRHASLHPAQQHTATAPGAHAAPSHSLIKVFAESALLIMLSLTLVSPACAAALGPQLGEPSLWGPVCDSFARHLPRAVDVNQARDLVKVFMDLSDAHCADGTRGSGGPTIARLFAALLNQPAFGQLLLRFAVVHRPAGPNNVTTHAFHIWLDANQGHLPVDGQQVVAIAQTMRGSGGPCVTEIMVLLALFQRLDSHAKKQLAFPAVAAHADRALDRALGIARGGAVSCGLANDGGGSGHAMMVFLGSTGYLPQIVVDCDAASTRGGAGTAAEWEDLRSRARWLRRHGVLAKSEALMRSTGRLTTVADATLPHTFQLRCALSVAVLLADVKRHNAPALSAVLSAVASERKLLGRWAAALCDPVPPSTPPAPAGEAASDAGAAANDAAATLCGQGHELLVGCLEAYDVIHTHEPLHCRRLGGSSPVEGPESQALVTFCALQLLPLLLRVATKRLRTATLAALNKDASTWKALLGRLHDLHGWGLADLTAAAGAPALLLRLLRTLRSDCFHSSHVLYMVAMVVHHAVAFPAWRREVARLSLVPEMMACMDSLGSPVVLLGIPPAEWLATMSAVSAAGALFLDYQAFGVLDGLCATPTWDTCLLKFLLKPALELSGGSCLIPWVGCCHRGCPNLSGDSEVALKLSLCAGCQLTRYCSPACQRKAWRSGHRAACLERQRSGWEDHSVA